MTPAIEAAKKAGILFKLHEYLHDSTANSYGEEAAVLLSLSPNQVFKTLVVADNDKKLAVAIVPVSHQLDMKAVAQALGTKKVSMANPADAEKATGYVLGGISPLGQKKRLACVIDNSAKNFESIYVSGGKRGLEIEIAPDDLIRLCAAETAQIKCQNS